MLPLLCSIKTEDPKKYHNIFKNGFFFYCDGNTIKVSCPKMFSNDSTIIDECLNENTTCYDEVADLGSSCKGSRLYTDEDTVCDSTTKYVRVDEPAIYILNCHEPKENDTQHLTHVSFQTETEDDTTTTTTTVEPNDWSFGARVHMFLLWTMGNQKYLIFQNQKQRHRCQQLLHYQMKKLQLKTI